jgi:hypothetical protein
MPRRLNMYQWEWIYFIRSFKTGGYGLIACRRFHAALEK